MRESKPPFFNGGLSCVWRKVLPRQKRRRSSSENSLSSSCSEIATGRLTATSPSRVSMQAQWRAFPTSSPRTALLAGAALSAMVSSNRRSIGSRFPRHPHYLAVAVFPEVRQFPISRLKRRRPRRQHPPGPLRGRGRRPYAGARSAALSGLLASCPTPGKYINGISNSSFLTVMGGSGLG